MSSLRRVEPSPPRTPLQNTTNTMNHPESPPFHTAKTTQSAKSRRKFSIPFFRHQNLDSSETVPSPHSSLWDAPLADQPLNTTLPVGDWDASGSELPPPPPEKPKRRKKGKRKETSEVPSPPAALDSSPVTRLNPDVHHPHLLDTITERSSRPTLRSYHPSVLSLRRDSPSISTLRARTSAIRKESFSLADLPPTPRSLASSSKSSLSIRDATVQPFPNTPQYDPPERMPTPPGLPSFNTPEAINYHLPSPQLSFRHRFRLNPTPEEIQYRRQTARLPPGVVMRGENGELIRGRWRHGGLSGHTGYGTQGALETHPFTRAPMAEVASEATNEAAIGSDSGHVVGIGPAEEQRQQPRTTSGKGTRWERFVEMTCYVCCGVESAADGQTLTATLPRREGERVRGQEAMMTGARPVGEFRSERRGFRRFGGDGWMY